ncbi:MAG: Gfo/Idh/MocA family oxidoreductase [Phycisphaerales bacterium]|nr:Gfo/Idh/MocA family oxidoreductase [Phycisphaerae bacterium]NNM27717.1 Gfo/Idh/MocA family oxidoreductase [Phycisphaerales bacterium]
MAKTLRIGMIGAKFMGRAHSNAWMSAPRFFDLPRGVEMHTVCARDADATQAFADRWGWSRTTTRWRNVAEADDIDLVDVATPNHVHADPAVAALAAGKHVACEKPLAATLADARLMRDAARKAKRRGLHTFVWFNYRRCPAVALAHQLAREGKLGRIHHVRAQYLQDWGGPDTPLLWRFQKRQAGSGAHGDLNAHIIDMARFILGDEIVEVTGSIEETFVKERRKLRPDGTPGRATGRSTVDDCVLFIGRFAGGATASFEATRLATGNQNRNAIEVNGEKGSIRFDFERMNELQWWDNTLEERLRGWSRILCTTPGAHPYVDAYWPPAHIIGYEHGFVSQVADIVRVVAGRRPVVPLPDFDDAYETQRVLEAALIAARERCPVKLREVR